MKRDVWFADWLQRAWPLTYGLISNDNWFSVLSLLAGIGTLAAVGKFVIAVINNEGKFLFYVNDVGHLILLTSGLAFFLPKLEFRRPEVRPEQDNPTVIAVKQFYHWLYGIIVLWMAFYFVRVFADLPSTYINDNVRVENIQQLAKILTPYVNVMSAVPLFGLYIVLAKRSVHEFFWGMGNRMWIVFVVILLVWGLELWASINGGANTEAKSVAGIANGIVVGGALALVVGRLDSRYIGLPDSIVSFLYLYALIQPLYPYIFNGSSRLMYPFVGLALLMKCTLLLTLGMIIDNRRFHFYVTNLRWLDTNAATMIAQHDAALSEFGVSRPMPPLFCFVHPAYRKVTLRFSETPDVINIKMFILNAWLGVGWDIKEFKVESVMISNINIPVKNTGIVNHRTLEVGSDPRHTPAPLYINLLIEQSDLFNKLRQDKRIMEAIGRKRKTTRVNIVLKGIKAQVAILEKVKKEPLQYISTPLEEVDGANGLFFECIINLDKLPRA